MNRTSTPPKNTRNKIYENQKEDPISPVNREISRASKIKIRAMAKGCVIAENRILVIKILKIRVYHKTKSSLLKY